TPVYNVSLVPAHCLDNSQNSDETGIDCGGAECKQCDGGKCSTDADCAGGRFCQKTSATSTDGFCLEKMFISNISPTAAAHGDYLSITGKFFGNAPGHVYFKNSSNADTEASMANCGSGFDSWIPNQLIVVVPNDAISSSIKVVTASTTGPDNVVRQFVDYTGTAGWKNHAPDFVLSTTTHPGICGVSPTSGQVGSSVTVTGKNFGTSQGAGDFLKFFELKAPVDSWASDTSVTGKVPLLLSNDEYAVKITKNGIDSNGVLFNVFGSVSNGPIVSGLSATSGVFSDYLTIYGTNFGNTQFKVWFSKIDNLGNEIADSAVMGNTSFPSICKKTSTWSDKQIIVKIPSLATSSFYAVRVERPDFSDQSVFLKSPFDTAMSVKIFDGTAAPGVCGITPAIGPVPGLMTLIGEHFSASSKVYFSKINSDPDNISTFASSSVGSLVNYNDGGQTITATSTANTANGPIFVIDNNKQSNSVLFKVYNCLANNNTCSGADLKCCTSGADAGSCATTCSDDKKSTGYMWVFSTSKIKPLPQVVERCGSQTELGTTKLLPSPSPAVMWNGNGHFDANAVCQTAFATVEFNSQMKQSTIDASTVKVYSCGSGNFNVSNCTTTVDVSIMPLLPANGSGQYIQFYPANTSGHRWNPNTWYQVKLMSGIKSSSTPELDLAATKPCGAGTAYCFNFKTKEGDCKLRSVVITPSSFWTSIIDQVQPIKVRSFNTPPYDLIYQGNGLSNQYCTLMNVGGLPWTWSSTNTEYADVTSTVGLANNQTKALAFKNTVGVGIFGDFVNIHAAVGTSSAGTCIDDGITSCTSDGDCKYTIYYNSSAQIKKMLTDPLGICIVSGVQTDGSGYSGLYSAGSNPSQFLGCSVSTDCTADSGFNAWVSGLNNKTTKIAGCSPVTNMVSSAVTHNSSCSIVPLKTGDSPLTIDLTNPEVADYGPNCLEACTNATVWARFNTTMSDNNVSQDSAAIIISKCNNENCTSLTRVTSTDVGFDEDGVTLNVFGEGHDDILETNSLYLVQLSTTSAAGTDIGNQLWTGGNGNPIAKPYNKTFSWRFRTKAIACAPSKIDVTPAVFTAQKLNDRVVFKADIYSAPDSCSVTGQKINPWKESWTWDSTDKNVATVQTFQTIGHNPFCTNNCVKKGSTIAAVTGTPIYAVCG
ncbi:MAG: transglutaminase protein, partial [uncultured bacterium]